MAMSWSDWLAATTTIMNIADEAGIAAFTALAPRCVEYAELRLYRDPDLDFLATRVSDATQRTTNGLRSVPIPTTISVAGFSGGFVVIEGVNLVLPANTPPALGLRVPLLPTSRPFIDGIWPNEGQVQTPVPWETYYAVFSQQIGQPSDPTEPIVAPSSILIGPTPDDSYVTEFTGTARPTPLSATNPTTFLTTYLPDLFLMASCIWLCGYQRDITIAGNSPGLVQYYEQQYETLKGGAAVESARQKMLSNGTTAFPPVPMPALPHGAAPPPLMPAGPPGR
jgi:hypothetical protein